MIRGWILHQSALANREILGFFSISSLCISICEFCIWICFEPYVFHLIYVLWISFELLLMLSLICCLWVPTKPYQIVDLWFSSIDEQAFDISLWVDIHCITYFLLCWLSSMSSMSRINTVKAAITRNERYCEDVL